MKLQIIAAGKIREKWLREGIEEYVKRLGKYCTIEIIEVPDSPDTLPVDTALQREGEKILSSIRENALVIAMDLHGKMLDSVAFSDELTRAFEKGGASVTFIID